MNGDFKIEPFLKDGVSYNAFPEMARVIYARACSPVIPKIQTKLKYIMARKSMR